MPRPRAAASAGARGPARSRPRRPPGRAAGSVYFAAARARAWVSGSPSFFLDSLASRMSRAMSSSLRRSTSSASSKSAGASRGAASSGGSSGAAGSSSWPSRCRAQVDSLRTLASGSSRASCVRPSRALSSMTATKPPRYRAASARTVPFGCLNNFRAALARGLDVASAALRFASAEQSTSSACSRCNKSAKASRAPGSSSDAEKAA
mmetsp:Transcript_20049/g.52128  ORF Transcript_20049/g.52128 Transcript_20049/m.52128 type:complete len:207 (-) Transcript_20049:421-1041(-)